MTVLKLAMGISFCHLLRGLLWYFGAVVIAQLRRFGNRAALNLEDQTLINVLKFSFIYGSGPVTANDGGGDLRSSNGCAKCYLNSLIMLIKNLSFKAHHSHLTFIKAITADYFSLYSLKGVLLAQAANCLVFGSLLVRGPNCTAN